LDARGMKFDTVEHAWEIWINYGAHIGFDVRRPWINENKENGHISSARIRDEGPNMWVSPPAEEKVESGG
ncbi:hypothetical protein Tco_0638128, partial [Tanacetum coccineum]